MLGGFLCYKLCPRLMGLLGQEDGETVAQLVKQLVTNHVHISVHYSGSSNNLHSLNSTQQRVSTS